MTDFIHFWKKSGSVWLSPDRTDMQENLGKRRGDIIDAALCSCRNARLLPVIPLSHTVVEPFAVVIKATHTLVASCTVL